MYVASERFMFMMHCLYTMKSVYLFPMKPTGKRYLFIIHRVENLFDNVLFLFVSMSQEVPPLDFQELLACLVRQSGPFLDHLGVKRGNKFVISCCLYYFWTFVNIIFIRYFLLNEYPTESSL